MDKGACPTGTGLPMNGAGQAVSAVPVGIPSAALLELAARVASAAEGSRELDCLIAEAVGYRLEQVSPMERLQEKRAWVGPDGQRTGWREGDPHHPWHYSTSLDAAMTLVPEGWWREIKGPRRYLHIPTNSPNYWSAHLSSYDHETDAMGWGATPALALTIACLKAIARIETRSAETEGLSPKGESRNSSKPSANGGSHG